MRSGYRLWVVGAMGLFTVPGSGQCPILRGTIADLRSQAPITEARMRIKTREKVEYVNVMNGKYQTNLPCTNASIIIEAKGYSTLSMTYTQSQHLAGASDYYVPFNLLPIVHQTSDEPYVQSEQSHTELQNRPINSQHISNRVFRVTDAYTEKLLPATVCLYYTQTARKDCFVSNASQQPVITFSEPDIIAVEVDVPGYQPYKGNLILDHLDNQTRTYTIRLQREVTVVSVTSPGENYAYTLSRESRSVDFKRIDKSHFYQFAEPGIYQLSCTDSEGVLIDKKNVEITTGLNILAGFIEKKNTIVKSRGGAVPLTPVVTSLPDINRLYFDQSEYQLRPASRNKLDSLAAWLLQNPEQWVVIKGHTDNVGNAQRNQTLSEFRAKVVCNYLINRGVAETSISWTGVGSQFPIAPNDTESNRQRNRRVEIFLSATPDPNN